jgi:hypothetical protein
MLEVTMDHHEEEDHGCLVTVGIVLTSIMLMNASSQEIKPGSRINTNKHKYFKGKDYKRDGHKKAKEMKKKAASTLFREHRFSHPKWAVKSTKRWLIESHTPSLGILSIGLLMEHQVDCQEILKVHQASSEVFTWQGALQALHPSSRIVRKEGVGGSTCQ